MSLFVEVEDFIKLIFTNFMLNKIKQNSSRNKKKTTMTRIVASK